MAIVYATRSSPTLLVIACLTLFADEFRRNPRLSRLRVVAKGSFRKPMVLPLLAITVLGIASAGWSAAPEHSLETGLQFAGTVFSGVSCVALVSRFRREHVLPFLAGGLAVALLVLPLELLLAAGIRSLFTSSTPAHEHNRTIVQLNVLATLFMAMAALSADMLWRVSAAVLVLGLIGITLITLISSSD